MRRFARVLLYTLLFFAIGEAVVRFDRATGFFRDETLAIDAAQPAMSEVLSRIESNTFVSDERYLRVMVIGDSYLHGTRMAESDRFSSVLRDRLARRAEVAGRDVVVLDLTVPGYNTFKNAEGFFAYVDSFDPHVVIWAYMINDVYSRSEAAVPVSPGAATTVQAVPDRRRTDAWQRLFGTVIHETYSHVKVLQFSLPTLNRELKLRGIILPGSQFHHEVSRSHDDAFVGWRNSREILTDVAATCRERGTHLAVLICPTLNMLGHYSVFDETDARIAAFWQEHGVTVLRGVEWFEVATGTDFAFSRYDGHPNQAAHAILAENVSACITVPPPKRLVERSLSSVH
ncbi:MAG: SGNH/GDSL hydrolase family protein [Candidatus Krumholzibacteriia bacterium]